MHSNSLLAAYVPLHENPSTSRLNPSIQLQLKPPMKLVQLCSQPPLFSLHSSISNKAVCLNIILASHYFCYLNSMIYSVKLIKTSLQRTIRKYHCICTLNNNLKRRTTPLQRTKCLILNVPGSTVHSL